MTVPAIFVIVEGHGDVAAVPLLLRRIARHLGLGALDVLPPYRIPRGRLLKADDDAFTRALALGRAKLSVGAGRVRGRVLIVLDSDDDCPKELADQLGRRASSAATDLLVETAVAKREFETWFIAAARSLRDLHGVRPDADAPADPETIRGAKEWLERHLLTKGASYRETADQPRLAAKIDLDEAGRCRSFRHLVAVVERSVRATVP